MSPVAHLSIVRVFLKYEVGVLIGTLIGRRAWSVYPQACFAGFGWVFLLIVIPVSVDGAKQHLPHISIVLLSVNDIPVEVSFRSTLSNCNFGLHVDTPFLIEMAI